MKVREFNRIADYGAVCEWWQKHKWPPVILKALPRTGLVVENLSGVPVVAGWLYCTDSCIGWVEWIVSNPDAPVRDRGEALDILITELIKLADARGITALFSSCKNKRLVERFQRAGFKVTDTEMTHLIMTGT